MADLVVESLDSRLSFFLLSCAILNVVHLKKAVESRRLMGYLVVVVAQGQGRFVGSSKTVLEELLSAGRDSSVERILQITGVVVDLRVCQVESAGIEEIAAEEVVESAIGDIDLQKRGCLEDID